MVISQSGTIISLTSRMAAGAGACVGIKSGFRSANSDHVIYRTMRSDHAFLESCVGRSSIKLPEFDNPNVTE